LDSSFLINTEHGCVLRRMQVQAIHISNPGFEVWIIG